MDTATDSKIAMIKEVLIQPYLVFGNHALATSELIITFSLLTSKYII